MKCYISGPISGKRRQEFVRDFNVAAAEARALGLLVLNPIEMDEFFDGEVTEQPAPEERRKFARRDLHVIVNEMKAEDGDVVVLLDGWKKSNGATAEWAVAKWVGIQTIPVEELEEYVSVTLGPKREEEVPNL